jgi:hypothetical protein
MSTLLSPINIPHSIFQHELPLLSNNNEQYQSKLSKLHVTLQEVWKQQGIQAGILCCLSKTKICNIHTGPLQPFLFACYEFSQVKKFELFNNLSRFQLHKQSDKVAYYKTAAEYRMVQWCIVIFSSTSFLQSHKPHSIGKLLTILTFSSIYLWNTMGRIVNSLPMERSYRFQCSYTFNFMMYQPTVKSSYEDFLRR